MRNVFALRDITKIAFCIVFWISIQMRNNRICRGISMKCYGDKACN